MKKLLQLIVILLTANTYAQVGINTIAPDPSAILDITSTTGGVLLPRMTTAQRDAIATPKVGLAIYNTTLNKFQGFADTGFAQVLDQSQNAANGAVSAPPLTTVGQNFVVGVTGVLTRITVVKIDFGSVNATLVVNGSNTTSCTLTSGLNVITLSNPLTISNGLACNFVLNTVTPITLQIFPGFNVYPAGSPIGIGISSAADLYFQTFVEVSVLDWQNLNELIVAQKLTQK